MKNRAAYMVGLNKMEIRETPVPEPKAGEVLVKIEYVGICGSDVHYFKDGRCGDFVVDGELMLGHEAGGVVEKLGEGVTDLKVGDKVALEPGITCGHCEFCKSGRYNLCPDVVFLATPLCRAPMRTITHSLRICASSCQKGCPQRRAH